MTILFVMALSWLPAHAENPSESLREQNDRDLTVSLITCFPGPEIYELCGHEAIRVRGEGIDSVWNYGIFDFSEPNFVYRFVKGETDYKGAGYPFRYFLPEYQSRGSRVVEQDLNLNPAEAAKLLEVLKESTLPENARYRYNYVKDNCATRILDRIDDGVSSKIYYPDSLNYGTFRNEMRWYHKNYPWYQFGIDLALGSGLDYKLHPREEMFVPVEMMKKVAEARFADGRPLVRETRILNEGNETAILPPTPWWQTPLFWSWVLAFITTLIICIDIRRGKILTIYYSLWFLILGLAGLLITFLVFISSHEATSPNALIFWLNPFQLILAAGFWINRIKFLTMAMSYYNIIVVTILLVVWPFLIQSANPAFFPLMGITVALAASYAIITHKSSYNNNGPTSKKRVSPKKNTSKKSSGKGKIIIRENSKR